MSSSLSSRSPSLLRSGAVLSLVVAAIAASCGGDPQVSTTSGSPGGSGGSGGTSSGGGGSGAASVSSSSSSSSSSSTSSGTGGIGGTGGTGGSGGTPCPQGTIECVGTTKQVCDGNGGYTDVMDCAPGVCIPDFGCAVCFPGIGSCNGNVSSVCKADGSGFDTYTCEPGQGVTCDPNTGACVGACAPQVLGQSFVGCDYYPTVTPNVVSENPFHFAVVVSNTAAMPANVKITRGAAFTQNSVVAASSVAVITLPWVSQLKNLNTTTIVAQGAYRLQSDQPVTVYQYNPLEYTLQNQFSYTNDASILLPVNTWTGNYRVAAYKTFSSSPGFYAITASQDNTTVTVSPPPVGGAIQPGAGIAANGAGSVTLMQGDVIEIFSASAGGDVTGALVAANKPVQVIGGHPCTFIPDAPCCCDHLEESVPPLETLSDTYIVTSPLVQGNNNPVAQLVRIIATADNTTLTYDPPQGGAPTTIAQAGGFVQLASSAASFQVTANSKIIVSQYMEGQFMVGQGDPAMTLAVPTQQYRTNYLFHAPTNYEANYVNVTAPTGAQVTIDGVPVAGFVAIGGSGFSVARVLLSNAGNGTHSITGPSPFGISVYGYGQYTSYWYPGGQNLQHL